MIARIKAGDFSAFDGFVRQTQAKLFRFCFRLCGSVPTAEELAQETYLRAFQNPAKIPDSEGQYAWLYTVARHLFIDRTRTAENKLERKQLGNAREDDSEDLVERLPDASAPEMEAILALRAGLNSLSVEDRVVLVLIDLEEHSYEEAAKIIGISPAAVRSRLSRARPRLVAVLESVKTGDKP